MRGGLAASIRGSDGTAWGLLQLSDKYEGNFAPLPEMAGLHFDRSIIYACAFEFLQPLDRQAAVLHVARHDHRTALNHHAIV